jgi:hypothetical protein
MASGLQAILWAAVAALLEAALRRRSSIRRAIGVLPLVLGGGITFMIGRMIGLALSGGF